MSVTYDYVIVGAGLTGAVISRTLTDHGKRCLVLERAPYTGGMCADQYIADAKCYRPRFGGHIFHTSDLDAYHFFKRFTSPNDYKHQVIAHDGRAVYALPFNMFTFHSLWGVTTPDQARRLIESQCEKIENPKNLEELALSTIGTELYMRFVYGYSKKQWGMEPSELPPALIKRIPLRYEYNTCYFNNARWQCMPDRGYSTFIDSILGSIDVACNSEYTDIWDTHVVYTGSIDEFFKYRDGKLEYRSSVWKPTKDSYGAATTNFTKLDKPYTRLIEFNRFYPNSTKTVAAYEYSKQHTAGMAPMYPVPTQKSLALYERYRSMKPSNVTFAGRLGTYNYMDMDVAITAALGVAHQLLYGRTA